MVEQRTENPCVGGSIPPPATSLRSQRSGERRLPRRNAVKAGRYAGKDRCELRLGKPEMSFVYVYILESISDSKHFYVGSTDDLKARLIKHNAGQVPHTSKFGPGRVKTAIAFTDSEKAVAFERYLKSASGRAFAKKRL